MTKKELNNLIAEGSDIMFSVAGRNFTIITWTDDGIAIGEQSPNDGELEFFETPEDLLEKFMVNGAPLGQLADKVTITQYA